MIFIWYIECGVCQSSLFNNSVVLHTLWSKYQHRVVEVALIRDEETYLDTIQLQLSAIYESLAGNNQSTSVYSMWTYLSGQFPSINVSLQTTSAQVLVSLLPLTV